MASKSPTFCLMLCTIMCMAMLLSSRVVAQAPVAPVVPGVIPFPAAGSSSQEVQQCWSSLANIPGCVMEIYGALFSGQFKAISPACCKAITEVTSDCWQKLFPLNPFFPPLLSSTCAQSGGRIAKLTVRKVALTGLSPIDPGNDVSQCLSSITNIQGCLLEVYGALNGNFSFIGPACCKAITQITDACWSKLFPFNPFFPPLLESFCGGSAGNVNVPSLPLIKFTFRGPGLLPPGPAKCWSSLANIQGCVLEIYGALSGGQFGSIGPACCKAIRDINYNCWPQMFPMNPLFPPLLTSFCAGAAALAPPPPPK